MGKEDIVERLEEIIEDIQLGQESNEIIISLTYLIDCLNGLYRSDDFNTQNYKPEYTMSYK